MSDFTRRNEADELREQLSNCHDYIAKLEAECNDLKDDRQKLFDSIVDSQPTVDAVPQWIPCSERMPEDLVEVNVTWVNHNPESYYENIKGKPFTATGIHFKGKWYWWSSICADMLCEYGRNEIDEVDGSVDIIAWMPLPKPYEVGHEAD